MIDDRKEMEMRSRIRLLLAAVTLGLLAASVSAAEMTTLRWTHPTPSQVAGFRVFVGYSSENYEPEFEVDFAGLTPINGIYQVSIEIDGSKPAYVALRAYNSQETSDLSNERIYTIPLGIPGRPRLTN